MTQQTSQNGTSGLLTTEDVAGLYRVDVATVRRWARGGALHCVRTPGGGRIRFPVETIVEHLGEGRRADVEAIAAART